jgi:hypothetical protein
MNEYPAELDSNYPPEDCVCEGEAEALCEACKEVIAEDEANRKYEEEELKRVYG